MLLLNHVGVDVLRLDFEKKVVRICVDEPHRSLFFQMVAVELVHENLRKVENAHPHIYKSVEAQAALMHLDGSHIVIGDVRRCEGWAGYRAPKVILLTRANQLDVNALAQVPHNFSKYTVVHQFLQVLLEVTGCVFFS